MSSMFFQVTSFIGALMILCAFIAAQTGWVRISARAQGLLNLVGSTLVAIAAARAALCSVVFLEATWALVSLRSLIRGRSRQVAR